MKFTFNLLNTLSVKYTLLLIVSGMILYSCSEEDDNLNNLSDEALAEETASNVAEIDNQFYEAFYLTDELMDGTSSIRNSQCADISLDTANRVFILDYGEGCTGPFGVERAGSITINYLGTYREPGSELSISFSNYTVNGNSLSGTIAMSNFSTNDDGQIFFTVQISGGEYTNNQGETITYSSQTTYTFISGERNNDIADNVYSIEGTNSGTTSEGISYTSTIASSLTLNSSCLAQQQAYVSSGVLDITLSTLELPASINFGDGSCDTKATLTYGPFTREINLR